MISEEKRNIEESLKITLQLANHSTNLLNSNTFKQQFCNNSWVLHRGQWPFGHILTTNNYLRPGAESPSQKGSSRNFDKKKEWKEDTVENIKSSQKEWK